MHSTGAGTHRAGDRRLFPAVTPVAGAQTCSHRSSFLEQVASATSVDTAAHFFGLAMRGRPAPISPGQRDLTRDEARAVWTAWKQHRLDRYLRDNPASSAVYEIVELHVIGRVRQ